MDRHQDIPRLRAYMLRFWKVGGPDSQSAPIWRFSLEDPHSGQKLGFADLPALIAFLQAEIAADGPAKKP